MICCSNSQAVGVAELGQLEAYLPGRVPGRAGLSPSEASGDTGALGTVELRYHTPVTGLLLSTYFDVGHVRIEKGGSDANISEDARSRQRMWLIAGGFPIKEEISSPRFNVRDCIFFTFSTTTATVL